MTSNITTKGGRLVEGEKTTRRLREGERGTECIAATRRIFVEGPAMIKYSSKSVMRAKRASLLQGSRRGAKAL